MVNSMCLLLQLVLYFLLYIYIYVFFSYFSSFLPPAGLFLFILILFLEISFSSTLIWHFMYIKCIIY